MKQVRDGNRSAACLVYEKSEYYDYYDFEDIAFCMGNGIAYYCCCRVEEEERWVESWDELEDGRWEDNGFWETYYVYDYTLDWINKRVVDTDGSISYVPKVSGNHSLTYCNGKLYAIGGTTLVLNENSEIYAYSLDGIDVNVSIPQRANCELAVGNNHILRRQSDGTVSARGKNAKGQLGSGILADSDTWQNVSNLSDVSAVYANEDYSAAIKSDGTVWMWGACQGSSQTANAPYKINGVSDVISLELGSNHVLALDANGNVYGWGGNEYGEINSNSSNYINTPVQLNISSEPIVDIAAGDEFSAALDAIGNVYVWGNNTYGQLLDSPSDTGSLKEVPLNSIVDIEAGAKHILVRNSQGTVYAWGDNSCGQLGLSKETAYASTPQEINGYNASKILAAKDCSFIKNYSGNVYSFGRNDYGQLGRSTADAFACDIKLADDSINIDDCAMNTLSAYCINNKGDLLAWGLLADGITSQGYTMTPLNIEYPYDIVKLDSFRTQTLAIDSAGQVLAWGEGYYANGTDSMQINTYPQIITGIAHPIQVSRGKNHNLVLDKNGDVWGWGSNSSNPMGKDLGGKVKTAQKLNNISNVAEIAAGVEYSLFLKQDGTLWGVGKNDYGQLGIGNTENVQIPVQITDRNDFIKVSAGTDFAAALASDGLYTWGRNNKGALGNGTRTDSTVPIKIDVELESDEKFIDVSAGVDSCFALTDKGNVYSWGDNGSKQLGYKETSTFIPKKITALKNIISISAGNKSSIALNKDGVVYTWGYSANGQLGHAGSSDAVPKAVTSLGTAQATAISAGYDFSVAATKSNGLYSFGKNESGQLGLFSVEAVEIESSSIDDIKWLESMMDNNDAAAGNLLLPDTAPNSSMITWTSGNTFYIADDGKLINRPDAYSQNADVTLYATVTNGDKVYYPSYTISVLQDKTKKPQMQIMGYEYEQISAAESDNVKPEITGVDVVEKSDGSYRITIQYNCSENAKPFFFWSAREGTFSEPSENYRTVTFRADEDTAGRQVKIIMGIGDGMGYVDKKAILLDGNKSTGGTE